MKKSMLILMLGVFVLISCINGVTVTTANHPQCLDCQWNVDEHRYYCVDVPAGGSGRCSARYGTMCTLSGGDC